MPAQGGPRIDECGTKEIQCESPRAPRSHLHDHRLRHLLPHPGEFVSYLIYCEIRLYELPSRSTRARRLGDAMGAVGAMGAVKHVATATAVAKPVMATAVAKPVVTATAVAAA